MKPCRQITPPRWPTRLLALALVLGLFPAHAAETGPDGTDSAVVTYPVEFFEAYQPVTARDIVEQLPGFELDDGSDARGFGASAGNVLVNGERPSSKTDSVSALLERIPAGRVVAVELIRGRTGRFDASGRSVLANVIVDNDALAWTWNAAVEQDLDSGGPTPGASVSAIGERGRTDWGAGVEVSTSYFGNTADEVLSSDGEAVERRDEFERFRQQSIRVNANTATRWSRRQLRINAELSYEDSDFRENSRRTPVAPIAPAFNLDRRSDTDRFEIELGGDFEWPLSSHWRARSLGLFRFREARDLDQQLQGPDRGSAVVDRDAESETARSESIARIELDYTGLDEHRVEVDLEAAVNVLDNELRLRAIAPSGGLVPVPVPGADNRVEEQRTELQLRDTWRRDALSVESTLAAEASRIRQSGSDAPERQFVFIKPSITLSHAPADRRIHRIRFAREVAQLDFGDFVSAADFADDDIDRGNPGLEPQRTWLAEWSTEQRYGEVGVAKLTASYRWVDEVQDLLPVDGRFEVPGNIGDGRRWDVELEATVPLDALFESARTRLDFSGRWEDSSVTDPVTGRDRSFSGRRSFRLESRLRQDLVGQRWAWGVETEYEDRRVVYELDEIDIDDRGVDLEAFVETTRFLGVKLQLIVQNLLDRRFERDRRVFDGPRDTSPEAFRELRDRRRGRSVLLSVSGSF